MRNRLRIYLLAFVGFISLTSSFGQLAMDFSMTDCSTNTMHHLYTDYLDNEEVVIIEFFMTCSSCIEAGQAITPMYNQLSIDYPGQVNFFAFNFLDDLDCSVANNFVTTFGINAIPFDSGGAQLAYYGGFGMPSVAIVGGSQHEILYFDKDAVMPGDTAIMDSVIRNFFTHMGSENVEEVNFVVYPNPASETLYLEFEDNQYLNAEINLCNSTGQSLLCQKLIGKNETIDIHALSPGVYFLQIRGENIYSTKKLIICK